MSHVLIVEDDRMNARLFEVILNRRGGFDVSVTVDPAEILRMAAAHQTDAIIMDVSLTDCSFEGRPVNGLDISRMIKKNPRSAEIPVILATAHAIEGDEKRFLAASLADDYIAKPVTDQEYFLGKIRKHLASSKTASRPRQPAADPSSLPAESTELCS
jgi:two-component system cell cycle response regulator DivK